MKRLEMYETADGNAPFQEWLEGLPEITQARIMTHIDRVAAGGSKKNVKPVGEKILEIKINVGPGFRVYYSEIGRLILLLLVGGDKSTQDRDIKKAKEYRRDYDEQNKEL